MANEPVKLTLLEKLGLRVTFWRASWSSYYHLFTSLFTPYRFRTTRRIFNDARGRVFFHSLALRHYRAVISSTVQTYTRWAKEKGFEPLVEDVGDGGSICWIGPKRTDKVFLWIPGGGFIVYSGPGWFAFPQYIQQQVSLRTSKDVGLAVLQYSLAPEHPFPAQMRQANAALKYLLDLGVQPSNLIVGGDSAGANLVLQVLSDMLHPDPTLPSPPAFKQPICGALLLSPYVSLSADGPTYKKNHRYEALSLHTWRSWMALYRQGVPEGKLAYAEARSASPGWWEGASQLVQDVIVTAGEFEVLIGDINVFVDQLQKSHDRVKYVVQKNGIHDEPIPDFSCGELDKKGTIKEEIVEWFVDRFRT